MLGPDGLFQNRQGTPIQRCRLLVMVLSSAENRQITQCQGQFRMIRSKCLFLDLERPSVESFRLVQVSPKLPNGSNAIEVDRDLVVPRSVLAFEDDQRMMVEPLGFIVLSLRIQQGGKDSHVRGHLDMVQAKQLLPNLDGSSCQGFSRGEAATRMFQSSEIMVDGRNFEVLRSENPLDDWERSIVEPLGFIEFGSVFANDAEFVTDESHFDRIEPVDFFFQ